MAIFDLVLPMLFVGVLIFLGIKFSGSPFRTEQWALRLKKVIGVMLFWSVARLRNGVTNLIIEVNVSTASGLYSNYKEGTDDLSFIISVIGAVVCELICYLLIIDYGFIYIFLSIVQFNEVDDTPN